MADSTEPKKETVRIALPPKPQLPGTGAESRETARIRLPVRPPPPRPPMAKAPLPPAPVRPVAPPPSASPLLPKGAVAGHGIAAAAMAAMEPRAEPKKETARIMVPGPKKETARIAVLPDPVSKPVAAIQMKKTQPLSRMPDVVQPMMPINVAAGAPEPESESLMDEIPMSFYWALLGTAAAVLIIQIWTYFS